MKTTIRIYAVLLVLLQMAIVRELQGISVIVSRYVKETLPAGIELGVIPSMATYWPVLYYIIPAVTLVAIAYNVVATASEKQALHALGASVSLFLIVLFFHVIGIAMPFLGFYGRMRN